MTNLFMKFQNCSLNFSVTDARTYIHSYTHTHKPKAICPFNFFKVGGIKKDKMGTFLELKVFKNNCSTMLTMHFQRIKQCHMTILTVIYWTSPYESRQERAYLTNPPLQNIQRCLLSSQNLDRITKP